MFDMDNPADDRAVLAVMDRHPTVTGENHGTRDTLTKSDVPALGLDPATRRVAADENVAALRNHIAKHIGKKGHVLALHRASFLYLARSEEHTSELQSPKDI